ncbi:mitochondrial import receptor subunit TOM5 [Populus alba x Populus x berolinensis]|uniref:Mitochondrial import receptor subunit TOM5 n=1 Tax=Populus alba x Populus x berolinensis TaxID=444605 RepID=A0AAD6LN88_9ROSI|nr:mitochondrial import receptor subunit TOM5 [Populus alba x Populus x berolinensis]
MADSSVSTDKLKAFWHSQVHDEEKWALNMEQPTLGETNSDEFVLDEVALFVTLKLLRAVGLFAGSIFLMRNYGDLMAI